MLIVKKLSLLTFCFNYAYLAAAQSAADKCRCRKVGFMRSEAKIYVVMVVVITILAGLILYLARLDRKLSKLEKGRNSIMLQLALNLVYLQYK